jgi:dienelactone hydrolase
MFLGALAAALLISSAHAETIELQLSDGSALRAELRLPTGPGPHPAVLVFGGFENAARVLDLVHPSRPVALASFDYPFEPPRKFEFPASLRHAPDLKRAIHRSIEGVGALARALAARSDIDRAKITVLGASFGAPVAVIAAAREPAISGLAVVHGFARLRETARHRATPSLGRALAWLLSSVGSWYLAIPDPEAEARALRPHQRVWMVSAEDDKWIPRESSDALWAGIQASRATSERHMMPGGHLMPGSGKLIAEILALAEAWMLRWRLL